MPGLTAESNLPEPAIRARVNEWRLSAPGTGLVWLSETMVAAGGDGRLHILDGAAAEPRPHEVHRGAVLATASDATNSRIVTGGDDGRVVATHLDGSSEDLLARPGRWIDSVAVSRKGQLAVGIGKAVALWRDEMLHEIAMPGTAASLAFDRTSLAVAHYGGVSLIDAAHPRRPPRLLAWKGSHIRVTCSPNDRFVVSVMSENALHGWRVKDGANMAMSGYPAKPRSVSWSADGRLLASSGADGAIVWSFAGANGPMGTSAVTLGERRVQVTALAWHPESPMLALGYRDGCVTLCRAEDGATLTLREADGDAVAHLGFSTSGESVGALTETGTLMRLHFPSIR